MVSCLLLCFVLLGWLARGRAEVTFHLRFGYYSGGAMLTYWYALLWFGDR